MTNHIILMITLSFTSSIDVFEINEFLKTSLALLTILIQAGRDCTLCRSALVLSIAGMKSTIFTDKKKLCPELCTLTPAAR